VANVLILRIPWIQFCSSRSHQHIPNVWWLPLSHRPFLRTILKAHQGDVFYVLKGQIQITLCSQALITYVIDKILKIQISFGVKHDTPTIRPSHHFNYTIFSKIRTLILSNPLISLLLSCHQIAKRTIFQTLKIQLFFTHMHFWHLVVAPTTPYQREREREINARDRTLFHSSPERDSLYFMVCGYKSWHVCACV